MWKDVIGYEGMYQVSNKGEMKTLNYKRTGKEKIMKLLQGGKGRAQISLCNSFSVKHFRVSRLVAIAFIPNPLNLPCVLHKNETLDENGMLYNGVDNLWWGTHSDNMQDKHNKGRANNHLQLRHPRHTLGKFGKDNTNSKQVLQYGKDGKLIKEWDCMSDIFRNLGINISNITNVCHGRRKTTGGFIWRFK